MLSTHPFAQKEAVWPKFILPHLPRRLFSLLGKHLEKCMKLKKRGIYVNILLCGYGEEWTESMSRRLVPSSGWPCHYCSTSGAISGAQIFLNHLWKLLPDSKSTACKSKLLWRQHKSRAGEERSDWPRLHCHAVPTMTLAQRIVWNLLWSVKTDCFWMFLKTAGIQTLGSSPLEERRGSG